MHSQYDTLHDAVTWRGDPRLQVSTGVTWLLISRPLPSTQALAGLPSGGLPGDVHHLSAPRCGGFFRDIFEVRCFGTRSSRISWPPLLWRYDDHPPFGRRRRVRTLPLFPRGLIERPDPLILTPVRSRSPRFPADGRGAAEGLGGQPARPGPPAGLLRTRPGDLKLTVGLSPQYLLKPGGGQDGRLRPTRAELRPAVTSPAAL